MKKLILLLAALTLPLSAQLPTPYYSNGPSQWSYTQITTFANLPSLPGAGQLSVYCTDCQNTTPCAAGGSGAPAISNGTMWSCNRGGVANPATPWNTFFGSLAGNPLNVTGTKNVSIGFQSLASDSSGSNNTAVGYQAGYGSSPNANTTGANNTFIGYGAAPGSSSQQSYMTVIGAGATGTCSSCVVLGRSTDTAYSGPRVIAGSSATDTATLGSEMTSSGTCSGTGWTGTYPNYTAPGTTAPLSCSGFTNGKYYQTVTTIGAGGSGTVTVAIGGQSAYAYAGSSLTAGLLAAGTSLTYTPQATYTGTITISAMLITPISQFATTLQDSTGAASSVTTQTLTSLHNYFVGGGGTYTTTGSLNVGFGYRALFTATTGLGNTALGYESLFTNTVGNYNTAVGDNAMLNNASGQNNVGVGENALVNNVAGNNNSALGQAALQANTGTANSGVGEGSLYYNTTGSYNTAVGAGAGYSSSSNANISGSYNTFIGYAAGQSSSTQQTNMTVIGAQAQGACSSCVVLGRSSDMVKIPNGYQITPVYSAAGTALPACAAGTLLQHLGVTDATSATPGTTYASGGTNTVTVECISTSSGSGYTWIIN